MKWFLISLSLIILLSNYNLQSQPNVQWTKTFGGVNEDIGNSIEQTTDGGFIISASTESFGAGNRDIWLIKTDLNGDTLWTKTIGGSNSEWVGAFNSIHQTYDGGYILIGSTNSIGAGGYDIWLIKTDSNGNKIWDKTFGGINDDQGVSLSQTNDGGFIIIGNGGPSGQIYWDLLLIKTDSSGNQVWAKLFGGFENDQGMSVKQTRDNGYIVVGTTRSFGNGLYDFWIIKTDTNGNALWTKTFGGSDDDVGYDILQTLDGGYIITGVVWSYGSGNQDIWLIKTDSNGNKVWDKTFGSSGDDEGFSIENTDDEGYIIVGFTDSFGNGNWDIWLIKTNKDGDIIWQKTIGGQNNDFGHSIKKILNSGYIIVGGTESFGAGNKDVYLVKIGPESNPLPNINLELVSPSSINQDNYFKDEILLNENRLILAPYIYLDELPSIPLKNVKVEAYLNNIPMNIQLNTIGRIIDSEPDGLIDYIPQLPNNGDLGVRFLIYSDFLNSNLIDATVKITIIEIDGNTVNISWEKPVSYFFAKTNQYPSFRLNRDSYKFPNLAKLTWQEFTSLVFSVGNPLINLVSTLFTNARVQDGRCWGMSNTAGKYFLYPGEKPYSNSNVFTWEPLDISVTNPITIGQLNQIIYLFNVIFPPNNQSAFQKLESFLNQNKPAILGLSKTGKNGGHAVLVTSLTKIAGQAFIRVYDNNWPYNYNPVLSGIFNFDYNISNQQFRTAGIYSYDKFDAFSDLAFQLSTTALTWDYFVDEFTEWLNTLGMKQISTACPVNLLIINSTGQKYGFDSTGNFINEIPGCSFTKVPTSEGAIDSITIIYAPQNENYEVKFYSYAQGKMLFSYNKSESLNQLYTVFGDSIALTASTIGYFNEIDPSNHLILDYDGNGQPDTVVTLTQAVLTSIQDELIYKTLPTEFILDQNYPNPFNPSTTISYSLPTLGKVQLKVFNILGQEIVTLVDEIKEAGFYKVELDLKELSSGIYLYKLQAGDFVETRKMILLK